MISVMISGLAMINIFDFVIDLFKWMLATIVL